MHIISLFSSKTLFDIQTCLEIKESEFASLCCSFPLHVLLTPLNSCRRESFSFSHSGGIFYQLAVMITTWKIVPLTLAITMGSTVLSCHWDTLWTTSIMAAISLTSQYLYVVCVCVCVCLCVHEEGSIPFQGGVVGIEILWDCNLDFNGLNRCDPKYTFRRYMMLHTRVDEWASHNNFQSSGCMSLDYLTCVLSVF